MALDDKLIADAKNVEQEGLTLIKGVVDNFLGYASTEIPVVSDDAKAFAEAFAETHTNGLAHEMVVGAIGLGSATINAEEKAVDAVAVAQLSSLQKTVDAHLAAIK